MKPCGSFLTMSVRKVMFLLLLAFLTGWSLIASSSSKITTRNRRSATATALDSENSRKAADSGRKGATIKAKSADRSKAAESDDDKNDIDSDLLLGAVAKRVREIIKRSRADASDVSLKAGDEKMLRNDVIPDVRAGARASARNVSPNRTFENEGRRPDKIEGGAARRHQGRKNIKGNPNVTLTDKGEKVAKAHRRTIVYSCNKITKCGGWADRQKGIVSAYVLSVLTDRHFKLDMPRPCSVSVYLEPNQVDWTLDLEKLEKGQHSRRDVEGIDSHGIDLVTKMLKVRRLDLLPELDADYTFITWNMELVHLLRKHPLAQRVPWLGPKVSLAKIYHYVLKKLFRPSAALGERMQQFLKSMPSRTKLACAQIRIGDSKNFNDSETFNSLDGVMSLVGFLRQYNDSLHYRILFASDNIKAIDMGQTYFPDTFVQTSGPISHVDKYEGNDACAGFGHAIFDQMLLSTCDVLVISESGLGKISAFMRNTDDQLYLFHDSVISVFRRDMSFPNRVYW